MEGLKALDGVAYVRFASVYRNFREARDFGTIIDELAGSTPDLEKSGKGGAGEANNKVEKSEKRPAIPASGGA